MISFSSIWSHWILFPFLTLVATGSNSKCMSSTWQLLYSSMCNYLVALLTFYFHRKSTDQYRLAVGNLVGCKLMVEVVQALKRLARMSSTSTCLFESLLTVNKEGKHKNTLKWQKMNLFFKKTLSKLPMCYLADQTTSAPAEHLSQPSILLLLLQSSSLL